VSAIDIVSIGEPMMEFNRTRPGEPNYLQGFGGDTSNMIVAAARAGARTAYVTRLGDDDFGRMFLALWKDEGVDTRGVAIEPQAHTGVYFVRHGPEGHVFSYLRAGSAASRMRPEDLPIALIREARYVYASGISMAISASAADSVLAAFEAARAAGMADYFFPSIEDAHALSGLDEADAILDWAHRLGAGTVFLKLGAKGAIASDGARREHIPGWKMRAIDATGAGGCFCGAALARLAAGDSIWDAARYANAAAALATTGFGAVAPLPRPEAVWRMISQASSPEASSSSLS
jgi:2-dehydro-3-deoxygluconokinase